MRAWAEGDRADHLARGIDQDAAIARIAAARDELEGDVERTGGCISPAVAVEHLS